MCGFYGEINNNSNQDTILKGLKAIEYRGPDHTDVFKHNNVNVGFNRLSIIDLDSSASQPMISSDERYIIVFNGEIYNYKSIRSDLEKNGIEFKTKSDTEVLLNAYIFYGNECLSIINGMFSFVVYDKVDEKIFLARDRSGQKPLVYYLKNNQFYFASEIKSILENLDSNINVSREGLQQYLALGYIIAPLSFYENIHKLQPGHFIEFKTNDDIKNVKQRMYWNVNFDKIDSNKSIYEYGEEFYSLFIDSIKMRLNSDVPLAVFLSGGLDSSLISSIIVNEKLSEVNAFTVDFDDNQMSEMHTVKRFLKKYPEINHNIINLRVNDLLDDLSVIDKLDEPFSDSSIIPTYWISKTVKQKGFTVAIGGDGGDELLGGYFKNKRFKLYDLWFKLTNNKSRQFFGRLCSIDIKSLSKRMKLNKNETYWFIRSNIEIIENMSLFKVEHRGILNDYHLLNDHSKMSKIISIFETYDFKHRLAEGYLTKVDKASMYNSLEVRNPFLDYRIIELLMKMPKKYKIHKNQTKYLLRKLAIDKSLLVDEVLNQKKKGFSVPLRNWVTKDLKKEIISTVFSSCLKKYLIEEQFLELFKHGEKGSMHNSYIEIIWRFFILSKVLNKYRIESL